MSFAQCDSCRPGSCSPLAAEAQVYPSLFIKVLDPSLAVYFLEPLLIYGRIQSQHLHKTSSTSPVTIKKWGSEGCWWAENNKREGRYKKSWLIPREGFGCFSSAALGLRRCRPESSRKHCSLLFSNTWLPCPPRASVTCSWFLLRVVITGKDLQLL